MKNVDICKHCDQRIRYHDRWFHKSAWSRYYDRRTCRATTTTVAEPGGVKPKAERKRPLLWKTVLVSVNAFDLPPVIANGDLVSKFLKPAIERTGFKVIAIDLLFAELETKSGVKYDAAIPRAVEQHFIRSIKTNSAPAPISFEMTLFNAA